MKIASFNVNGIRAITKKNFYKDMEVLNPDILCLQETKATVEQVKEVLALLPQYQVFANEAQRKGYSGTAILTKTEPISVVYDMGVAEHDNEGRVVCAEFQNYFVICVYVPNSGSEMLRLSYRQTWDKDFLQYLKKLENAKPVIVCGDFNVAHKDIDLARPKQNYNKAAGYMQEEIDGMNNFIDGNFIDTFRFMRQDEPKYSWWSYRMGAREKNVGWRIDYLLVSTSLSSEIINAEIHNEIHGSDHCPVSIELKS